MRAALTRLRSVRRGRADAVPVSPSSRAAPPRVLGDPIPLPPTVSGESAADFRALGDEIYRYLVTFCRVRPTSRVLDVACGYAPVARPLARWLVEGTYDGIEADLRAFMWCRENIASRFPTFRFRILELDRERIAYPFFASVFDAVVLWDVLTRATAAEVEQHLAETARVLRPGRWALAAFHLAGGTSGAGADAPKDGVVHSEEYVRELIARSELEVVEPIHGGRWSGCPDGLAEADLVVVRKPFATAPATKPWRRMAALVGGART